ncbi:MAG: phosphatidate cytidylyltransferase [Faecalibacterium sp.]|nr:phosphatidate cytidylyltransferase [Ruminococcus sp.]MCM1392005.1 phosphatidate cytidylyltransferase [Ruminococcus sp.]MCM1485735.1 phosphatidate cytidylyltransferase [Faecalibacterium sp.]
MSKTKEKKGIKFKGERTQSTIIIIIGLLVFVATIIANFTIGYTLITAAVSAMATYELVKAVGAKSKLLFAVTCAVSALTVMAVGFKVSLPSPSVIYSFYALALLIIAVACNKTIKYTDAVMGMFASVALPYAFSCFIRLNNIADINPEYTHLEGIFLVMMVFTCSWLTDTFAFLVGRKIGKHKMSPNISPKKSVEGAIFGTLVNAAFNVLLLWIFSLVSTKIGHGAFMGESSMKYLYIIPISIVLSVVSMFGDLAASVLKRNVGIKDYSNLLPGHGGIMDRFDSTLFVLPTLYGIFALLFA